MKKEVIISPNAERELKKLPHEDRKKAWVGLKKWSSGELKLDIEKIKSQPNFYRLKIGNIRLVYYPLSEERVVLLLVRDRKDAYRGLSELGTKLNTAMKKLRIASG